MLAEGIDLSREISAPRAASTVETPPPPASKRPGRRRAAQEVALSAQVTGRWSPAARIADRSVSRWCAEGA